MNIAFLGNQWLPHTKERIKQLVNSGNNVIYISWPHDEFNTENICLLPRKNSLKWKDLVRDFIPNILFLRKLIKKNKIEYLHIMGITNGIYCFFISRTKIIVEHNGSDILVVPEKVWYFKWYYKIIYKFTHAIVQDSLVSKKAGLKYGAPTRRNEIIDIGVDFNIFNENIIKGVVRKKYSLKDDCKIIFQPRGFRDIYNNDIIIESIIHVKKYFSDIKYIFSGYYEEENRFIKKIKDLNLEENVIFYW